MRLAASYSFNGGKEAVTQRYPNLLVEINDAIHSVDASKCKTKRSEEGTMLDRMLYAPSELNTAYRTAFEARGWKPVRVKCEYSDEFYEPGYTPRHKSRGAFREMDFVKDRLGVEVQFGKYAFMVYNVAAKMTIFSNLGIIDCGVEIVPVKALVKEMSSGVSYIEQFVWDLKKRGVSNIDIPVLILGVDADETTTESVTLVKKVRRRFATKTKPGPKRKPPSTGITIVKALRPSRVKKNRKSKD
jgi:hypothetical protein